MVSFVRHAVVLVLVVLLLPANAMAKKLSPQKCQILQVQKKALIKAGAAKNMSRGAKWAMKNLSKPALEDIKRLIQVSEQLLFRCGQNRMQHVDMRNRPVPPSQVKIPKRPATAKKSRIPLPKKKPNNKGSNATDSSSRFNKAKSQRLADATRERKKQDSNDLGSDQLLNLINNQ